MRPTKSQKKKLAKKLRQAKSKPESKVLSSSALNAEATEFVPNCVTEEGAINSVSVQECQSLSADHKQNLIISGSETSSSFVSTHGEENTSFSLSTVDQIQNYNTRSHETHYDVVTEQCHGYSHSAFSPVSHNMPNFTITDVPEYTPVTYSMDQIQNYYNTVGRDYDKHAAVFHWQVPVPIPIPHPEVPYLEDQDFRQRYRAVCATTFLPGDDWDTWENPPNPQPDYNNIAFGSTASCLPEHNQLLFNTVFLPETPKEPVIAMPQANITSEDQTIDSTLANKLNITTNEEAYGTSSSANADSDTWENPPNLQPGFNNIPSGSTASCLPEHNKLVFNAELLPENPKELVIATIEDIISKGQTTNSTKANERDTWENSPNSQSGFNNIASGLTASSLPNNNQLLLGTTSLPDIHKESVISTPEDIISESQPMDSMLTNKLKIIKNEEACEFSSLAFADTDTRENQPNPQLDFNNIARGSTASCLPQHKQLIAEIDLLPETPKDSVITVPEGPEDKPIINEDRNSDSVAKNEDNNNVMNTNHNEKEKEYAGKSKEKNHNDEEAQKVVPVVTKNIKKKNKSHVDEVFSKKEHVNVVFVGHVDAGKSTIGGQLMWLTGMVDKRTMEKYKKEAKEKSRDSWYISWALDTNQEERDKGKTVETGRGYFETETKHYTILDAPGHKSFIPSMICGTAQADVAVLVLSARQNEFESGFDKGGQTRDHAMLVKLAGVKVLIALINKMDDPTVKWAEKRYIYCRDKTIPYLKKLGFASKDVYFMPVSGQTGDGLLTPIPPSLCPWFKGPSFIKCLDNLSPIAREYDGPFVMPIVEKFKDKGTVVMGKIEAGSTHVTSNLLLMPNKVTVSVDKIWSDDKEVTLVKAGENVKLKLKGIEEEEISPGFVLCDISKPITIAKVFDAQMHVADYGSIICAGFTGVMHTQCVVEEVEVMRLLCLMDPKTNEKTMAGRLRFAKSNEDVMLRMRCSGLICLTTFKECPKLGCFTLREDNKVIAFGIVLKIIQ